MERHDGFADLKTIDFVACSHHHTCHLMPEDPGCGQQIVLDLLEVCMTDSTSLHPNQQLAAADLRGFNCIDAYSSVTAIHCGRHRSGHRPGR